MAQAKATSAPQSRLQDLFASRYAVFYVLVLPAFLLRMIYTVIPIIQTVLISFTNRTIMGREIHRPAQLREPHAGRHPDRQPGLDPALHRRFRRGRDRHRLGHRRALDAEPAPALA